MEKRSPSSFNNFPLKRYIGAIRESVRESITQTEIMTRAACPRKWFYRYALMLERKGGLNYHLVYGSMLHAALAELYKSGMYGVDYREHFIEVPDLPIPPSVVLTPADREELELIKEKVQIAFNAYRMHYYKADSHMWVRVAEETFSTDFFGVKLEGKIDLVAHPKKRDGLFVWDFKTAGRFDAAMLDAWSFRFQFLYYCWLYWRCTGDRPSGIMVNGLAKSQLRPKIADRKTKQKESKEEYLARVKADMQINREKFFYRQRMPLIAGLLERFEHEMLIPHINSFKLLGDREVPLPIVGSLAMSMNTNACHVYGSFCEYLPLCKDGLMMVSEYQKRQTKHEELSGNEIGQE